MNSKKQYKIAHISDVHHRNTPNRREEYDYVLEKLYDDLRSKKPDIILLTGDILHSKLVLSSDSVDATFKFHKALAEIAPVYSILGNHDLSMANKSRLDSLTPIIENLQGQTKYPLVLHKKSGSYEIPNTNIVLGVLSIIDKKSWPLNPQKDQNKIYIALFHGPIDGSKNDIGFALQSKFDASLFAGYDYAMLGDIHKTNQRIDAEGKIRYPGSLIQQDFGEAPDKGYLFWTISGKNDFTCDHVQIPNIYSKETLQFDTYLDFITLFDEALDNPNYSQYTLFRVFVGKSCTQAEKRDIKFRIQQKFTSQLVPIVLDGNKDDDKQALNQLSNKIVNYSDVNVLSKIIDRYLRANNISDEEIKEVLDLHHNMMAKIDMPTLRADKLWKLKDIVFDNFLVYGENNRVRFDNMHGLVGLFAKNDAGKSTFLDTILYCIHNNLTKNIKSSECVNYAKTYTQVKALLEVDGQSYVINRKTDKKDPKRGAADSRTTVDFFQVKDASNQDLLLSEIDEDNIVALTEEERRATEPIIREKFGTYEDLMATSFVSQFDLRSFISEGKTSRLDQIIKFLGLSFFEKLMDVTKKDMTDIEADIKAKSSMFSEDDITRLMMEKDNAEKQLTQLSELREHLIESMETKRGEIDDMSKTLISVEVDDDFDSQQLARNLSTLQNKISTNDNNISKRNNQIESDSKKKQDSANKLDELIGDRNVKEILENKSKVAQLNDDINDKEHKLALEEHKKKSLDEQLKILEIQPWCKDEDVCKKCLFLDGAREAQKKISKVFDVMTSISNELNTLTKDLKSIGFTEKQIDDVEKYARNIVTLNKNIKNLESLNDNAKLENESAQKDIDNIKKKLEANSDLIEKINMNEATNKKISVIKNAFNSFIQNIKDRENEIFGLRSEVSSLDGKITNIQKLMSEITANESKVKHYRLYSKIIHRNGIPFYIIRSILKDINVEINKILSGNVDWTVEIEAQSEGRQSVKVYVRKAEFGDDIRLPIEASGGAVQCVSALAVRMALTKLSTLPKPNFLILDEPFVALDGENLTASMAFLEKIKTMYDFIIMISHLETLQEAVDYQVGITKDADGSSHIWKD
jgi:DNA repair exonuclease SbcCD ATPase subunit/DNA repair exonuclease SbcCD nuclease subunit